MSWLLGHLAATYRPLVHAASLIVANLISDAEAPNLFASQAAIDRVKLKSRTEGTLDGAYINQAFTWALSRDLVWNFWINNYLLGNPSPANEIFYWGGASTRQPARLHAELLDIQTGNLFAKPRALKVLGTPIDLSDVQCDKFILGGSTDHLSPWRLVYRSARLFGGNFEYCLNLSGHVQSIVTPPGNPKLKYLSNSNPCDTAEAWQAGAQTVNGSWWERWSHWLSLRSGQRRPAPAMLGNSRYRPLYPAPGKYVVEP